METSNFEKYQSSKIKRGYFLAFALENECILSAFFSIIILLSYSYFDHFTFTDIMHLLKSHCSDFCP